MYIQLAIADNIATGYIVNNYIIIQSDNKTVDHLASNVAS